MIPVARWRIALWGGVALLLLLPLVAMLFTKEVGWTRVDFAVAALLLGGGAAAFEGACALLPGRSQRVIAAGVLLLAVGLVWAQGAVGIF